jgi:hypothetical protein
MLEGDLISSLLFCPCYYSRLLREKWPKLFHETLEDINKDANNDWGQLLANLIDTPKRWPRTHEISIGLKKSTLETGLPDFSWPKHTKMGKIYQMTTNYTKRP